MDRIPQRVAYLTRPEVAERCRVPLSSLDKYRMEGLFPEPDAVIGKHLLWRIDTIDELLARGGTAPERTAAGLRETED